MKRYIAPTMTSLIIGGVLIYLIVLTIQNRLTVVADFQGQEIIVAVVLWLLLLATWYYSTIGWYHLNKPKITLSALWIIIVLCGAYIIVDPNTATTFLSDIMRLTWVYVLISGLAGFIGNNLKDTGTWSMATRIKNAEVIEV